MQASFALHSLESYNKFGASAKSIYMKVKNFKKKVRRSWEY